MHRRSADSALKLNGVKNSISETAERLLLTLQGGCACLTASHRMLIIKKMKMAKKDSGEHACAVNARYKSHENDGRMPRICERIFNLVARRLEFRPSYLILK